MKSPRPHLSWFCRRSVVRCLLPCFLFLLLPLASHGKVTRASSRANNAAQDAPSGFLPGNINYFAGDGPSQGGSFTNGAIPTQVPLPNLTAVASDGAGNIYIATSTVLYMVYAGGPVPVWLANVTTNATPALTPQQGLIYEIGGLGAPCASTDPSCGEGGPLDQASFANIIDLAFDQQGNMYIEDSSANVVREVTLQNSTVTTIAGQVNVASSSTSIGDGGPAAGPNNATLNSPSSMALDPSGNIYILDQDATVVRVVYAASATAPPAILAAERITGTPAQQGNINTVAGQIQYYCPAYPTSGSPGSPGACGDYGPATTTNLGSSNTPSLGYGNSIAVDASGNIYIVDTPYEIADAAYVRVVYAGGTTPPLLNLALNPSGGNSVAPTQGYIYAATGYSASTPFTVCAQAPCGDGGLAGNVELGYSSSLISIILDSSNNLYLADTGDWAVRKIDTSGYASTVAGIDNPTQNPPSPAPAPAGGPATGTQLSSDLTGIAFDPQSNLYILDPADDLVWEALSLLPQSINFAALQPVTYGVNSVSLTATASSGLPISYSITATPANIATLNGSQLIIGGAGTVRITATQAGNGQYAAAAPVTQSLTIDPALLTVTANSASKLFGQPNPTFTANFSGFISGDTVANSLTGQPAITTTATTNSSVGVYPITISQGGLSSTKYTFTFVQGATLTITGDSTQTITFPQPPTITYGQPPMVTLAATASSGLPVQYTVVSGPATNVNGGAVLTITGGGTVVVTAAQNGNNLYQAAPSVTQSFVVKPASLTVTGPTVSQTYGTAINPGSFPAATITGFVGNDNQSLVTGSAQYATVTGTPNTGTYPITVSQGSLAIVPAASASYVLSTYVNGQLTITPASQVINLNPVSSTQTYGNLFPLTAVATSSLPITFTLTGPGYFYNGFSVTVPPSGNTVQVVPTGVGTITVTATQAGNGNITAAPPVKQAFHIGPAPLDIGVAQVYSIEQGAALPVFQPVIGGTPGQPGGFVNGDSDIPSVITGVPLLTTIATPSSAPGTYAITPSQGTLAAPNYSFVYLPGTLIITPPGAFTITSSPASLTIPSGLSAQATLAINPVTPYTDANGNPQQSLYQGTVTLSCGAVPANITCTISPSTYTFPGNQAGAGVSPYENPAIGTITISASGATVVGSAGSIGKDDSVSRPATLLIPGALAGLLLVFARKRASRHSRIWAAIVFVALGAGLVGISSCGGSSKSLAAAPGTSTVTITGSGTTVTGNGSVTATLPLTVTIQ